MTNLPNINDTWFDEFNSIFTGCVSLVFNVALMFAIPKVKSYSDTTLAYIIEAEAVYIVKGGFKLPIKFGQAMLITFVTFVIFSCMGPPMQFSQVAFILKKNPRTQKQIVLITTLISFLVSLTAAFLITFGYVPDAADDKLSEDIVYYINGKGKSAYLIASLERYDFNLNRFVPDPISWACTLYIVGVLVLTTVICLVFWIVIKMEVPRGSKSSNAIKSQKQLNTVLIVQFTLPFLTIHIPFYMSFLMPLFRVETSNLSIYLPYLFSWCPALNPILVFIMVKSIREQAFFNFPLKSDSSAMNMFTRAK
ncbi:hypothetical protein L3Y34_003631 [Caenorhabditis briggsae]|uniref:Uncharacterized protein n=1 Tax=Caenorhabditis briggsae TaxID=6238 RepID=A0AAE9AGC4_CAEBR|nr:hypothetical protein L3Y34_003631 [Caenorhabditis briggsae]